MELGEYSEDEEFTIGVMEKGGRLQFVRSTDNDIQSRSPTPTSSENETENGATKTEKGKKKNSLKNKPKGKHSKRKNRTDKVGSSKIQQQADVHHLDTEPLLQVENGSSNLLSSVFGSQGDLLECRNDSGVLSVASQTEFDDSLDQLTFVESDKGDLMQEDQHTNKEPPFEVEEKINPRGQELVYREDNLSSNVPTKPEETRSDSRETVSGNISFNMSAMSDDPEAKQKLNDAAFRNWLEGKNRDLRRRHRESVKSTVSEKELEDKKKRSEIAYRSWLERKSMDDKGKLRNARLQFQELFKEQRNSIVELSFEDWLQNKIKQRRKEAVLAERARQEQEEVAKHVNPSLSRDAFNKYVQNK